MIVHDFNVPRPVIPNEAQAPLVIDTDRMLALAIALQCFKPIAWQGTQIRQAASRIQSIEPSERLLLDCGKPSDRLAYQRRSVARSLKPLITRHV